MHDPLAVAFEIKYPWGRWYELPNGHRWYYREPFITIWHKDPETGGSDDSCGWFKRAHHGSKEHLEKIAKDFSFEWDAEPSGLFDADGKPRYSSQAITLCLFRRAAYTHFNENWRKVERFMQRNLSDILLFAENPIDSLHQSIVQKYGQERKDYRVKQMASVIYGWILRAEQPWWRHARWHVHHWRIQVHPWQKLRRWLFERCSKCGKGYSWGYYPIGNWDGKETWHHDCERPTDNGQKQATAGA